MRFFHRTLGMGRVHHGGFTLVELLVVIAIIGILASVLFPALAKAKAKAQAIKCLSNMRQWGLAVNVYTTENDDRLPRDGTDDLGQYSVDTGASFGPGTPNDPIAWFNVLPPGTGQPAFSNYWANGISDPRGKLPFPGGVGAFWHCPAARSTRDDPFLRGGVFGFFSLVMNVELKLLESARDQAGGRTLRYPQMPRLSSIPSSAATVLLTDVAFSPTLEPYTANAARNGTLPAGSSTHFSQRHDTRGANLLFVDGHASFFKRSYITNGGTTREEKFNPDVVWNPNREKR